MSKLCCRNSLLIIAAVFLVAATGATTVSVNSAREPVVITSNRMEAAKLGDKITFSGSVTLKKESMTISSDTMIVFYDTGSKDIRQIDAHGNVIVRKEDRVALANDASYYSSDEKIVLTGDARIIENENQLGGKKITLFMRDNRSLVEGGKVLLYQDKQEQLSRGTNSK
jgi:lipopolysaccharide export system protein LptA